MPPSRVDRPPRRVGEFDLIERLRRLVPTAGPGVRTGIGDDAAVVSLPRRTLVTCDVQVEGVHFRRGMSAPGDVGWRALAVNVSDIASMGGAPRYALVSVLLPPGVSLRDVEAMYRGIGQAARAHGVIVVGGNISRTSGPLALDVTLLGEAGRVLTRGGARPGDGVWVTGTLGNAAAGLFLARRPRVRVRGARALLRAYRRPSPRVRAGRALAARSAVTAAIDISDGTAQDLAHVLDASGVGAVVHLERVPVAPAVVAAAQAAHLDPYVWALGGGEDYELLFTARPGFETSARAVARVAGVAVTRIGEIVPRRAGRWIAGPAGRRTPLRPAGWDHLATRAP
jgi:thiamine-monophosphate kinase